MQKYLIDECNWIPASFGRKQAWLRSADALALRLSNFQKHNDTSHAG